MRRNLNREVRAGSPPRALSVPLFGFVMSVGSCCAQQQSTRVPTGACGQESAGLGPHREAPLRLLGPQAPGFQAPDGCPGDYKASVTPVDEANKTEQFPRPSDIWSPAHNIDLLAFSVNGVFHVSESLGK